MMTKKLIIKTSLIVVLLTSVLVISLAGWLSSLKTDTKPVLVGDVVVSIEAYYDNDGYPYEGDVYYDAHPYGENPFFKNGVYKINLSTPTDPLFITKFRVVIKIASTVDTYFRIAPYEQLTLTYQSGGKTVEVATTQAEPMPFNYKDTNDGTNPYFYDNRNNDGYFYYTSRVKRVNETTELEIPFIVDFGLTPFNLYEEKYTLQLGFIIEAVQSERGPLINWGMPYRPWDEQEW